MIAIGDCAGQMSATRRLVERVRQAHPDEKILFLGDVVDRGPNSAQLIAWIRNEGFQCLFGNHESMMLEWYDIQMGYLEHPANCGLYSYSSSDWYHNGGLATLRSYHGLDNFIPRTPKMISEAMGKDIEWVRALPWYVEEENVLYTHAPAFMLNQNWRDLFDSKHRVCIWNRSKTYDPNVGKLNVFGHNGKLAVYTHGNDDRVYGMCVDDTHNEHVAAVHVQSGEIYREPF